MRSYATLGCQKADVASTQACSLNRCTTLGVSVVSPVTLIKELTPMIPWSTVISQCTEQPSTVSEAISYITDAIPPMYRRSSTIGAENSILLAFVARYASTYRTMNQFCRAINLFYRAINPFYRAISQFYRPINQFYRAINQCFAL